MLFYIAALVRSFYAGYKRSPSAIPALFAILFSAFFESWLTASLNPFTIQCIIIMTMLAGVLKSERVSESIAEKEVSTSDESTRLSVNSI
jgi:hypothetical protein